VGSQDLLDLQEFLAVNSAQDREYARGALEPATYWERVARTRWGGIRRKLSLTHFAKHCELLGVRARRSKWGAREVAGRAFWLITAGA
jgi:hypothetical protein